jgi:hypothetical protein
MAATIIVDDPVVATLAARLAHAARLSHSGRTFLEHLLSTWRILADWGVPLAVQRAGFMHSAYSTSFYPHALFRLDQRDAVRRMIGRDAEGLVYRFCTMDRRGFWDAVATNERRTRLGYPDRLRSGTCVRVSRKTLERLLIIESANIAEQSKADDRGPAPWMSRVLRWWQFLEPRSLPVKVATRPTLSRRAELAAIEAYRRALKAPPPRASALLDEAIRRNPWAGEPQIMRALCALERGDERAPNFAGRGLELLTQWATPWDKRLSTHGWKALADRVADTAVQQRRAPPQFESVCAVLENRVRRPRWLSA